jgi:hypothetical protein
MELPAHSLAEAYLYLMAQSCAHCRRGPIRAERAEKSPADSPVESLVTLSANCATCGRTADFVFRLPAESPTDVPAHGPVVNPTDEPSHILDVGQWLTLFRMIAEAAARETRKPEARHLGLEAAQCLEEALRFYDDPDNDLPPPEAFFTSTSRDHFRDHPHHFSRRRLLELRSKLPSLDAMRQAISRPRRKSWWRR